MAKKSYNRTSLMIGDKVQLTNEFLQEGRKFFGSEFCRPKTNHEFTIVDFIYGNGEIDGHHEYVKDQAKIKLNGYKPKHWVTIEKDTALICALFLKRIM